MLVRKGGDAPDYRPQVVGKIEPKQTFKVSVKVGVRAAGVDQKLTFQLMDGYDNEYFGPLCQIEYKIEQPSPNMLPFD